MSTQHFLLWDICQRKKVKRGLKWQWCRRCKWKGVHVFVESRDAGMNRLHHPWFLLPPEMGESQDHGIKDLRRPLALAGLPRWCYAGDIRHLGSIPGWERSPGGGNSNPLQYSSLENPMDRGAWWATVHGVTKNQTQLSDYVCMRAPYKAFLVLVTLTLVLN